MAVALATLGCAPIVAFAELPVTVQPAIALGQTAVAQVGSPTTNAAPGAQKSGPPTATRPTQRAGGDAAVTSQATPLTTSISASPMQMEALLQSALVLTGRPQRTFLKIDLTGEPLHQAGARAPVNVALVLDRSSSMAGDKLEAAKQAAIAALSRLGPDDVVSVIAYDHMVYLVAPATRAAEREAITLAIAQLTPGGSTALFAGVSKGAAELRKFLDRERMSRVILLSDGLANVGPSAPGELAELGRSLAREGISVTTFGLGLDYNEDLMSQLAMASDGNHAFIESSDELARIFDYEFGDLLSVVARDVTVQVEFADGVRPLRCLGREAVIAGQTLTARLNQVYASQEKYLLVELELPPIANGSRRAVADVSVRYMHPASGRELALSGSVSVVATTSAAKVEESLVQEVVIASTELLANEQNKLALALRDQGEVEQARSLLEKNAEFLRDNNKRLRSKRLEKLEQVNRDNASNLDESKWNQTRKSMRDTQFEADMQQMY